MRTIADHILDISSNSIAAGADRIRLDIVQDTRTHLFVITVRDNGRGMTTEVQQKAFDPFFTTRAREIRRFGLGLPFLRENTELTGGRVFLSSRAGVGTVVCAIFHTDHIDCLPLGDLPSALLALLIADPSISWYIRHKRDKLAYTIQTEELRSVFTTDELTDPVIQVRLLGLLREWEQGIGAGQGS